MKLLLVVPCIHNMELPVIMYLIFAVLFLSGVFGAKLPSNFKRCSSQDTTCLKDAIQDALPKLKNGIPELGVPSLDPICNSKFEIAPGANVVKLVQKYTNAKLYGLSTATIENVMFDLEKKKIKLDFTVPVVELNATYDLDGQILALPVRGKGKLLLHLDKVVMNLQMDLKIVSKGNEKYIKGKHSDLTMDGEYCSFLFNNLNGDSEMWRNLNIVLNENWRPIFDDIVPHYAENYGNWMMEIMNKLFETVPMSEIFTDK